MCNRERYQLEMRYCKMKKENEELLNGKEKLNLSALEALDEVTLDELDQIIGAGNGVLHTISHECNMNTWQFMFTCCA